MNVRQSQPAPLTRACGWYGVPFHVSASATILGRASSMLHRRYGLRQVREAPEIRLIAERKTPARGIIKHLIASPINRESVSRGRREWKRRNQGNRLQSRGIVVILY